jgi:RNA polymerase sigma factor FliA
MSTTARALENGLADMIPFPVAKSSSAISTCVAAVGQHSDEPKTENAILYKRAKSRRQITGVAAPEPDTKIGSQTPSESALSEAQHTDRRDQLVLMHLALVQGIARRVHENLPIHVGFEDIVHAGILGLFDAAGKYDECRHIPFRVYAKHRIKGAILDSLREMDWASRDLRRRHKRLEEVTREPSAMTERQPTEIEIAEKMGMELERWSQVAIELRMVGLLSASTRSNDTDDGPAPDFPAASASNPGVMTGHRQLKSVLATAMSSLPARHGQVIHNYYTGGNSATRPSARVIFPMCNSAVTSGTPNGLEK